MEAAFALVAFANFNKFGLGFIRARNIKALDVHKVGYVTGDPHNKLGLRLRKWISHPKELQPIFRMPKFSGELHALL